MPPFFCSSDPPTDKPSNISSYRENGRDGEEREKNAHQGGRELEQRQPCKVAEDLQLNTSLIGRRHGGETT